MIYAIHKWGGTANCVYYNMLETTGYIEVKKFILMKKGFL